MVLAEIEHLVDGLFVDEAGDVVQRAAVCRREIRRVRVQEVEGDDHPAGARERISWTGLPFMRVGRARRPDEQCPRCGRGRSLARCVHGHEFAGRSRRVRARHAEEGRDAEFAGDVGQVPGDAPLFGHDRGGAVEQRGPPRQGLPDHQDRTLRETEDVGLLSATKTGPLAAPGLAVIPPRQMTAASSSAGVGAMPEDAPSRPVLLLQRTALEQENDSPGVDGPLDVLGRAVVAFQGDGHSGELDRLLRS